MRTVLALAVALLLGPPALADSDPCSGYKWDVAKERALFAAAAQPLTAGTSAKSAAAVETNRLYSLKLAPAAQVAFAAAPGKSSTAAATFAGIFSLRVPAPGKYRISIDQPVWIDVIADGALLAPSDYEGVHGCSAPRKIVVFALQGVERWTMQVSGADQASVRLTITPEG